jgi:hypothetical protein
MVQYGNLRCAREKRESYTGFNNLNQDDGSEGGEREIHIPRRPVGCYFTVLFQPAISACLLSMRKVGERRRCGASSHLSSYYYPTPSTRYTLASLHIQVQLLSSALRRSQSPPRASPVSTLHRVDGLLSKVVGGFTYNPPYTPYP